MASAIAVVREKNFGLMTVILTVCEVHKIV